MDYNEVIKNTTDGYVYLTTNLHTAYYYGNINLIEEKDHRNKYVYVFKLKLLKLILI